MAQMCNIRVVGIDACPWHADYCQGSVRRTTMTVGQQPRHGTTTREVAGGSFPWEEMGNALHRPRKCVGKAGWQMKACSYSVLRRIS